MISHLPRASCVGMDDLVRLLLISALAWILVGCSSPSQQTHRAFEYAGRRLSQTHYEQSSKVHSKRRVLHGRAITAKKTRAPHRKHSYSNKIAHKSNIVTTTPTVQTKSEVPPSSQPDDVARKTEIPHDEATKTESPPSSQLDDESVGKKAKASIAAKMRDPDSVVFERMERAARKNAHGKSIDSICGFVKDKNSGTKPFLYLVEKDEGYIGGYNIATSEYRNICSTATLPGR
jgi:hypothetical protein